MKVAAISLNFDSLSEAYGFPENYEDPTFTTVAERFFSISQARDFRYSIYVIGKDLEKKANRDQVKAWGQAGHEIGNHSYSHPRNLAGLSTPRLRDQIHIAHHLITEAVGVAPKGFIAPSWAYSHRLIDILIDLDYQYDTSVFPSWLYYPILAKLGINYIGSNKLFTLFQRRDYIRFLTAPRQAHQITRQHGSLLELPVPTTRQRMACWHSLAFILGWNRYERLLRATLDQCPRFYYVIHPADLISSNDLDPNLQLHLQRMDIPYEIKYDYFIRSLDIIQQNRQIVLMHELATKVATPD